MTENKRLAVLVDADNVSSKWTAAIFKEIATLGDATVRRIYGNFAADSLSSWRDTLLEYALIPHHQPAYTKRKNSSDIALVIDAMDILHSDRVDGFVLVSSDSDFTRLASRIREEGLDVIGIGKQKTPESLRKACKRFIFLENLEETSGPSSAASSASAKGSPPKETNKTESRKMQPPSKIIPLVMEILRTMEEDWVTVGLIGSHLYQAKPDFDPRTYGCTKLTDLLDKTGAFEVNRTPPARIQLKSGRN